MAKDWIDLKIDTDRMTSGADLAKELRKGAGGGIPWLVILDADGKGLITSDAPKGNIGCPAQPEEIDWFLHMLRTTRQHTDDTDLAAIEVALRAYGEELTRPRKR